jgi:F0F1-type ATP synthase epsilon subunit
MRTARTMHLRVLTRGELIYEGNVSSFSGVNELGKFDVLVEHANFISMVRDYLIIREPGSTDRELKIGQGILRVGQDKANVYLGIKA